MRAILGLLNLKTSPRQPLFGFFKRFIFGQSSQDALTRYYQAVSVINTLEPTISTLSDEALKDKTTEFKDRLSKGETLEDLLPEAFAIVRETGKRTLNMRHFDVQLIGGMVLHEGKISEMKTGEGKTLVATLPAYLNALSGKGIFIVLRQSHLKLDESVFEVAPRAIRHGSQLA